MSTQSQEIFDTLQYAKRAISAGFTQEQAEFQTEELASLLDDSLITKTILKQELSILENRLQLFQYRFYWAMLGSVSTLLTVVQLVLHFFDN